MTDDALALPRRPRDLRPPAARRRARLTGALLATLDRWGYDPVVTPAIEYFAVFGRWLAERDRQRCVRFIEAGTGELVTLRSDITPQIARLTELRLGERLAAGEVLRLCYAAEVVRLDDGAREHGAARGQAEHHQVGAVLLGGDGPQGQAGLSPRCGPGGRGGGCPAHRQTPPSSPPNGSATRAPRPTRS